MAIGTKDIENIIKDANAIAAVMDKPITVLEFRQRVNGLFNMRDPNRNLKEPEYRVALEWLIQGGILGFTKDRLLTNDPS